MVPELRRAYNAAFSEERYRAMCAWLEREGGSPVDFRISETPVFLDAALARELERAAWEIQRQVANPAYLAIADQAIPPGRKVPGESRHPAILQADFALAIGPGGAVVPRLIELQGFPSLFGFQWLLGRGYQAHFPAVPRDWLTFFSGLDEESYARRLREFLLGDEDPESVVLLEVHPEQQKTRIDFHTTERMTGVRTVDALAVRRRGRRLFYRRDGREIEIRRIYNRVIFDELERKRIDLSLVFAEPTDVEWLPHPDWFFKISKWSLPHLAGEFVPPCHFVSDLAAPPADLESYVLKPIYSFAGLGVQVDVTRAALAAVDDPRSWILQRKVEYAPLVETPDGFSKVEVRMMFLWDREPQLVNSLVRMSKGRMLGVDFNKDKTWIGASVAFHPPLASGA